MVKHHILIGLGFKKNHRNKALQYMMNQTGKYISGGAVHQNQMTIMPVNRRPLKFNY